MEIQVRFRNANITKTDMGESRKGGLDGGGKRL